MTRRDKYVNFAICLIDAAGFPLGIAFFSPQTILPTFLARCGASPATVGALIGVSSLLILAPGLLVIGPLQRRPLIRGWLFWVALIERLFLLPLAFLALVWGKTHPGWLIGATFLLYGSHSLAMGFNIPAYWTAIAKTIPGHWRGRLFGIAGGIAGLCTLGTEWLLRHVVLGGGFPGGYGRGFLIGFAILTVTMIPFLWLREPRSEPEPTMYKRLIDGAALLAAWKSDAHFRRLSYSQICFAFTQAAVPFLALYAARRFGEGAADLALYTAVSVFAGSIGSLIVGWTADHLGNRPMVAVSCVCGGAAFLLALFAPNAGSFSVVFALWALAISGVDLASSNLMMELAADSAKIPLYSSLYNVVRAAPRALAPWLGGIAAGALGYGPVMVFAALAAFGALALLGDSRRSADAPA